MSLYSYMLHVYHHIIRFIYIYHRFINVRTQLTRGPGYYSICWRATEYGIWQPALYPPTLYLNSISTCGSIIIIIIISGITPKHAYYSRTRILPIYVMLAANIHTSYYVYNTYNIHIIIIHVCTYIFCS